jgi:hypothetical protein
MTGDAEGEDPPVGELEPWRPHELPDRTPQCSPCERDHARGDRPRCRRSTRRACAGFHGLQVTPSSGLRYPQAPNSGVAVLPRIAPAACHVDVVSVAGGDTYQRDPRGGHAGTVGSFTRTEPPSGERLTGRRHRISAVGRHERTDPVDMDERVQFGVSRVERSRRTRPANGRASPRRTRSAARPPSVPPPVAYSPEPRIDGRSSVSEMRTEAASRSRRDRTGAGVGVSSGSGSWRRRRRRGGSERG